MKDENKKVIANIQGVKYPLVGDVTQEYMDQICDRINHMINQVKKDNPFMNQNMALLLCSLNLSEEVMREKEKSAALQEELEQQGSVDSLKEQIQMYKEYADKNSEMYQSLNAEYNELKEEVARNKEDARQYYKKMKQYKHDVEESRKTILDLQNQLFESQIQLVKGNNTQEEQD
ncbi:MAG TPA: hypothetical protein DHN33_03255 [Eubacteriaceae bacterium]|nr:hypothetical protein [Eubacteriaceae bacterium]